MPSSLVGSHEQASAVAGSHDRLDSMPGSQDAPANDPDTAPRNENAPLLSADAENGLPAGDGAAEVDLERNNNGAGDARGAEDDAFQQTKSVWYLVLLTLSIGGLQVAWSVELSNGSPYLLSLGLSKSLMALVWIAGPLSGTLVQPYVGMLSDRCRVRWGKRKPFMLGGAAATIVSLLGLAWTRELVAGPLHAVFGVDPDAPGLRVAVIVVAVLWVYVLDFAINTVQAAIRAFIVDCAPAHQQEAANAMASRITGVGNIVGYVAGYANLPRVLWWLGDTQFKDLCAIASLGLGSTVLLSCLAIRERDPRLEGPPPPQQPGVLAFFRQILAAVRRLPPQVRRVCLVQFCAWVGFFPMLFYTSSYIGEIYVEPFLEANPHMTLQELDRLYEQATRVGTFALLIYSITSLCTNVFLPFFIAPTYDSQPLDPDSRAAAAPRSAHAQRPRRPSFAFDGAAAEAEAEIDGGLPPLRGKWGGGTKTKPWLEYLVVPGLTLRRAWMLSLLLFSFCMFCTVLVHSVAAATALIGLVGITWALTLWAPWAIISAEISRRDALLRAQKRQRRAAAHRGTDSEDDDDTGDDGPDDDGPDDNGPDDDGPDDEEVDQAGVILGIHNMAIAAPQILATVGSSIVFKFLQKPRGTPGDHSIAVVMALGGITVLLAAYYVHKIEDEPADVLSPANGYAAVRRDGDEGSGGDTEADSSLGRRVSSEQLSRTSLERAAVARNASFGSGLEY